MSAYVDEDDDGEEERVPQQVAELARAAAPSNIKGIRACKRCGILKTLDQFINAGCENCPFLEMVSVVNNTSSWQWCNYVIQMIAHHIPYPTLFPG
jgi:hypothetical protein